MRARLVDGVKRARARTLAESAGAWSAGAKIGEHRAVYWAKRLLVCNPFYLVSAAMMIYGVYLVSADPALDHEELSQLQFNFSSLQLYELLLVVTAAVLARRAIWYDSTLLIWLENIFVFVPFMLLSQASLIGSRAAWLAGGAGVVFALGKFWGQRRYLPKLNFPKQLAWIGVLLVGANVAFPMTFRHLVIRDSDAWTALSDYGWLFLMPSLMALALLLPHPSHWGGDAARKSWLPFGLFLLWMAATAAHFHSVNYVDGQKFRIHLVAPLVWALMWILRARATDFTPEPPHQLKTALMVAPVVVAIAGASNETSSVFFLLTAINAVFFAIEWVSRRDKLVWHLLIFSGFALVAGMPGSWGRELIPDFSREKCVLLSVAGYMLLWATVENTVKAALFGAVIVGLGTEYEFSAFNYVEQFALQNSMLYLLIHSLRWNDWMEQWGRAWRFAVSVGWIAHSFVWLRIAANDIAWTVLLAGLLMLGFYYLARLISGRWGPVVVAASAGLVVCGVPGNLTVEVLRITPSGHLTVLGSFILFAVGTILALTKDKWSGGLGAHPVVPNAAISKGAI